MPNCQHRPSLETCNLWDAQMFIGCASAERNCPKVYNSKMENGTETKSLSLVARCKLLSCLKCLTGTLSTKTCSAMSSTLSNKACSSQRGIAVSATLKYLLSSKLTRLECIVDEAMNCDCSLHCNWNKC